MIPTLPDDALHLDVLGLQCREDDSGLRAEWPSPPTTRSRCGPEAAEADGEVAVRVDHTKTSGGTPSPPWPAPVRFLMAVSATGLKPDRFGSRLHCNIQFVVNTPASQVFLKKRAYRDPLLLQRLGGAASDAVGWSRATWVLPTLGFSAISMSPFLGYDSNERY